VELNEEISALQVRLHGQNQSKEKVRGMWRQRRPAAWLGGECLTRLIPTLQYGPTKANIDQLRQARDALGEQVRTRQRELAQKRDRIKYMQKKLGVAEDIAPLTLEPVDGEALSAAVLLEVRALRTLSSWVAAWTCHGRGHAAGFGTYRKGLFVRCSTRSLLTA
jgi:hypothetical protein